MATGPVEDHSRPTISRESHFVREQVAILLAIAHDNGQFVGLLINRLVLSVHGTQIERGSSDRPAIESLRHLNKIAESRGQGNGRLERRS
jgi:hypothetical protein